MNIGNTYAENRMYRGIKVSNNLPLLAEDIHEFSDTMVAKNMYLLDSLIGSGILNNIVPYDTNTGLRLREPAVLNILGDICLIHTSDSIDLIDIESLKQYNSGTLVIVGWYQNITANDTMREYGGLINSTLENNLLYEPLNIQPSSRYQFCWFPVVIEGTLAIDTPVSIPSRDSEGRLLGSDYNISLRDKSGSVFLADAPIEMDYTKDGLYFIPLIEYTYDATTDKISSISISHPRQKFFLNSDTEPVGTYSSGTTWYNPVDKEFHTYVEGVGFVPNTAKMGFLQYRYINIETTNNNSETPKDLSYTIDEASIPSIKESDIIKVTYEGLELFSGSDYTLDIDRRVITLKNFTRLANERLIVTVLRLVEANDVTSLTDTLVGHMNLKSGGGASGHVKLSDSVSSSSGVDDGIAATPKAVRDSQVLTDNVTGTKYKLSISNGTLGIVEVV